MGRIIYLIVTIVCDRLLCLIVLCPCNERTSITFVVNKCFSECIFQFSQFTHHLCRALWSFSFLFLMGLIFWSFHRNCSNFSVMQQRFSLIYFQVCASIQWFILHWQVEMFFIYSLIKLNHIPSVSSSIKTNWTDWPP